MESYVAGTAFFWAGYVAYPVCAVLLGMSVARANVISYLAGWSVNYLLQRYWVFNNPRLKHHAAETTSRYIILSAINLAIDTFIIVNLNSVGITPYIGKFISAGYFTVWNYFWYRYWVFPEKYPRKKRA